MVENLILRLKEATHQDSRWRFSLLALALFSAFTNFWGLANVERSEYYASIPKSMSLSFTNFLFGAMDPGGVFTVDKIPGSFWIPAIFIKLFGFSTWAITVPNALSAIVATLVITTVVRKYYGKTSGLIAGSILASTPIVIAVARSNQPQTIYYLTIAIAIRFSLIALNESSRKHLIWAGIWIALAFHAYMLLAWVLWPPLILGYLLTNQKLLIKIKDLLISGSISLFASGIWIILVALTPASSRPYVGGTNSNSALELVTGYNGFARFTDRYIAGSQNISRTFTPPFGGEPGPFRLFNIFLIGQIGWLLPTAIVSIALLIFLRHKSPAFIFITSYLALQLVIFSAVLGMHQFYVSTMAIPIAIIIAISVFEFRVRKRPYFIIAILMVTSSWALIITLDLNFYLFPAPILQLLALVLFLFLSFKNSNKIPEAFTSLLFIAALVLTPALWAVDTLKRSDAYNPMAGPTFAELGIANAQKAMNRVGGVVEAQDPKKIVWQDNIDLIKYIRTKSNSKFALVTFTGMTAAPYINATNDLIYPIGGFNGEDPFPTLSKFKSEVEHGNVRFILTDLREIHKNNSSNQTLNTEQIKHWVSENCTLDSYLVKSFQLRDCK